LTLTPCLFAAVVLAASLAAFAHGDEQARHGGVVQSVRDISYELASHDLGLMLYVADHGNPMPTAGMTGTLVLMQGTQRTDVALQPAGENTMLAKGAKLRRGQRPTAVLAMPSGRSVVIAFPLK